MPGDRALGRVSFPLLFSLCFCWFVCWLFAITVWDRWHGARMASWLAAVGTRRWKSGRWADWHFWMPVDADRALGQVSFFNQYARKLTTQSCFCLSVCETGHSKMWLFLRNTCSKNIKMYMISSCPFASARWFHHVLLRVPGDRALGLVRFFHDYAREK